MSCFLVLFFVLASWLLGFKAAWFQNFEVSCFLINFDLISKLFKTFLDGSLSFVGARLFRQNKMLDFKLFVISKKMFHNDLWLVFDLLRCPGVSKDNIIGFASQGHVQKS